MLTKHYKQIKITHSSTYIGRLFILLCLFVGGCQQQQLLPDTLDEYHTRLARVLALPEHVSTPVISLDYPSPEQRNINIPRISMPLADFYAISECELAPLIAQRNTSLGKVEPPSRRLVYEATLLHTITRCIELAGAIETQANATLYDALTSKQSHYPKAWANLIQNSQSIRLGLGFSPGYIEGDISDGFVETKAALQYLLQARSTPPLDITHLESQLAILESFRLLARLYRSTQLLTQKLGHINQQLSEYNNDFTCANPAVKTQIKILNNVMKQFFIQELQPIASHINRYQHELAPVLNQIMSFPDIHPSMSAYLDTQTQSFDAYQTAFKDHVGLLQQVLAICGLRPTVN